MITTFLFILVLWTFSLCLHEAGHALVAYWGGDHSVKEKGYLTLNPLKYTDPVLSLVYPLLFLALGGIGLPGGCVYIDHSRLKSRAWESLVSLAGPTANALVALVLALLFWSGLVPLRPDNPLAAACSFLLALQVCAVLFNLLPIPPLDGYGILAPWLDERTRDQADAFGRYGLWVVFLLFWYVPSVSEVFWNLVWTVTDGLGVPSELAWQGLQDFKFWQQE
jgi:Zn-dependent protease